MDKSLGKGLLALEILAESEAPLGVTALAGRMGITKSNAHRLLTALVATGYREIVLTGVDIASYGPDLPGRPTLGQMARRLLAAVPELPRLRLSSIDPAAIDADLWRLIETEPRLMPHLHLSMQAGSDLILKRMKRRHLRQQGLDVIALDAPHLYDRTGNPYLGADGKDLALPGLRGECHDRRLVENDAPTFDVDQRVRRTEVDAHVRRK